MNLDFFKSQSKKLVIINDNQETHAIIIDKKKVLMDNVFSNKTKYSQILDYGKKQGTSEALFLLQGDIQNIEIKLNSDLDAEERHATIEHSVAMANNDRDGSTRTAYIDGMLHDFHSGILVSSFDASEIKTLEKKTKENKQKFAGVLNLKQLLIATHFSNIDKHETVLLFFSQDQGFVATPYNNKLTIRNLPFAIPEVIDEEWLEKIKRRLTSLSHKNVILYANNSHEEICTQIKEATEAKEIIAADWQEFLEEAAVFFFENRKRLFHTALPQPKPKDPHAAGTILGLTIIATVLFAISWLYGKDFYNKKIMSERLEQLQNIEKLISTEDNAMKKLEQDLAYEQDLYQLFSHAERVSKRALLVINLLQRYPLQYTKINTFSEEIGGIYITGETIWQPDLSKFFLHFEQELNKYDLTLISDSITKEKDGKIIFHAHITKGAK